MRRFQRLRLDERGISAVVVMVSLIGLFGALVLSLDAGSLWAAKRGMVTATDAGALAGARSAADNAVTTSGQCPQPVLSVVTTLVTSNQPTATLDACMLFPRNGQSGYITVDSRKAVSSAFAGVFGFNSQSAFSSTSVSYGYPITGSGLRPAGICVGNDHVQEWLRLQAAKVDAQNNPNDPVKQQAYQNALTNYNNLKGTPDHPTNYPTNGVVHHILFGKQNAQGCGSNAANGNWGIIDFENGNNGNCLNNDFQYGYYGNLPTCNGGPGSVGIYPNDPNVIPCATVDDLNGCVAGNPGTLSNGQGGPGLKYLRDNGIQFVVPVFGAPTASKNGQNTIFPVLGFIGMRLWGYDVTQPNGNQPDSRYMDVEFLSLQLQGKCCASTGLKTGALSMTICSVDHDPVAASTRCTPS